MTDKLAYWEWSAPEGSDLDDPAALWAANPAMAAGRITEEFSRIERAAMDDDEYARERLGMFPDNDDAPRWEVITEEQWRNAARDPVALSGTVTYAVEATPDGGWAAISAAMTHPDGVAVEVGEHREGRTWLLDRVVELAGKPTTKAVLIDPEGPVGSLVRDIEAAGVTITRVTAAEYAKACAGFYDAVAEDTVHHFDDDTLTGCVARAKKRTRGDVWMWDRRDTDVTPLATATLARWGHLEIEDPVDDWDFVVVDV
ncbi:hypothetical protein PO878_03990 [Iamia majanohamensis]|uniref:Uncharacterized protein n=1 Tax=Iamia majanohamensis TaxID=467976 RepID=A0AAF0BWV6_9ACTN|nr:hypothetical protein [Iamia majanohamensis]WCO67884.1 hypothetical protein PO878_03990 [Iamia majanohamensis]